MPKKLAPRIPQAQWEAHRETICQLYTSPEASLETVIRRMRDEHGFVATPAQYITKFTAWQVRKYKSNEQWNAANALVCKRKSQGKATTEILINGETIPEKKLKRALARVGSTSHPVTISEGSVIARTPPNNDTETTLGDRRLEALRFPSDDFSSHIQQLLMTEPESSYNPLNARNTESVEYLAKDALYPDLSLPLVTRLSQLEVPGYSTIDMASEAGQAQVYQWNPAVPNLDRQAIEILAKCFEFHPPRWDDSSYNYGQFKTRLVSRLRTLLIHKSQEEIMEQVDTLWTGPFPAYQFIHLLACLSSNNQLPREHIPCVLQWITQSQNMPTFGWLRGLNIHSANILGDQLLIAAAADRQPELVRHMIKDSDSISVILEALSEPCRKGDIATVRVLLSHGARIHNNANECRLLETRDSDNHDHLSFAVEGGHAEVAALLVRCGARIDTKALKAAYRPRTADLHLEISKTLVREGKANMYSNSSRRSGHDLNVLLHFASRTDDTESIKLLYAAGADMNAVSTVGTALTTALRHKNTAAILTLITLGVDVNQPCGDIAVKLNLGRQEDRRYWTPLHFAVHGRQTDAMKALVCAGADPARVPCQDDFDKFVVEEERDRFLFDDYRKPYADCLVRATYPKGQERVIKWPSRLKLPDDGWLLSPLQLAVAARDLESLQYLLRTGTDVNAAGGFGTALQVLAMTTAKADEPPESMACDMARCLLDQDAKVNSPARGPGGRTALQAAVENGTDDLIALLIQRKADVNAPACSTAGITVFQAAIASGRCTVLKRVSEAGASMHLPSADVYGLKCLRVALAMDHIPMLGCLLILGLGEYDLMTDWLEPGDSSIPNEHTQGWDLHHHDYEVMADDKDMLATIRSLINKPRCLGQSADSRPTTPGILAQLGSQLSFVSAAASETSKKDQVLSKSNASVIVKHILKIASKVCGSEYRVFSDPEDPEHTLAEDSVAIWLIKSVAVKAGVLSHLSLETLKAATDVGPKTLGYLLRSATANTEDIVDCLHYATAGGHDNTTWVDADIVRTLLNALIGKGGRHQRELGVVLSNLICSTSFEHGIYPDHFPICQLLIKEGADLNALGAKGLPPLSLAAQIRSPRVVRFLLNHGADPNGMPCEIYKQPLTALQFAVKKGELEIAHMLLEKGALVNAPQAGDDGETALELAARNGHLTMVSLLLQYDGDVETMGYRCEQAAKAAESRGHPHVARYLREWRASR